MQASPRSGETIVENGTVMPEFNIISKPVARVDARGKATGQALFPGDPSMPGVLYTKTLFAECPHARIINLKKQIAKTKKALDEAGYNPASVREQVASLAQSYGSPALDIGTGACACLAIAMARSGLSVTAIDHASSAVRIALERTSGELSDRLEIRYADAASLPFPGDSYRVVAAFDALCHAVDPAPVIAEMFRVCASGGAIIVTELNNSGRQVTRHLDDGFEKKLPGLLARYCQNCRKVDDTHHVTLVCERT